MKKNSQVLKWNLCLLESTPLFFELGLLSAMEQLLELNSQKNGGLLWETTPTNQTSNNL